MDFLTNPNVSYVLLILGFLIATLALFSPGTGILEIFALFALVLAGYGIANNPTNWWAIGIMILSIVPFIIALRQPKNKRVIWVVIATLCFVIGSAFLFPGEGFQPGVNPILILTLSPLDVGLAWLVSTKAHEASSLRPDFDLNELIGMIGNTSSDIRGQGSVYVNGEEWTAVSKTFIPAGSKVGVIRREGLILEIEPVEI